MVILKKIANRIKRLFLQERILSLGEENGDKFFYVIRVDYEMAGIMAIVKSTLSHIVYAKERGYIPVVDLLNCKCQYIDKENPFNVWTKFFTQPCKYDLCDVQHSKNLIISKNIQVPYKKYGINVDALYGDKFLLAKYKQEFKSNIHFNTETQCFMENAFDKIIGGKRCLGVLARGTDYLDCHPKGHPVQPEPLVLLKKAEEVMRKFDYHYLFLATEDKRIHDVFNKHFGERLLFNNQKLLSSMSNTKYISQLNDKDGLKSEKDILNYLSSLYILSKCNAFIGGCTAGTIGAYMMSDQYEYEYFWNLGRY